MNTIKKLEDKTINNIKKSAAKYKIDRIILLIKETYAQKLILDEEIWLTMIKDRNMTPHLYQEEMAKEIATRIIDCYINEFNKLIKAINT